MGIIRLPSVIQSLSYKRGEVAVDGEESVSYIYYIIQALDLTTERTRDPQGNAL